MLNEFKKIFVFALLSSTIQSKTYSAIVPPGTKLSSVQVLNKDNSSEPSSLDPSHCRDNLGANIIYDLFEGLVIDDANGVIVPAAAHDWKVSADGLKYTFFLRKNAKWSDGSPVTANDFVYSFRRFVDPKTAAEMAYLASVIKNAKNITEGKQKSETLGVKALNPYTLEITLETPVKYFLSLLSGANFVPLKKETIEKHKSNWTNPNKMVSNGAYKLTAWNVGEKTTLEKNPFYWDSKNTIINQVNNFVVQDKTASLRMYEAGQLDWTYGVPPGMFQNLKMKYPEEMRSFPSLSVGYLTFNTTKPPFDNKKLREALSIIINRTHFTKYISGKNELPIFDFPPFGIANYEHYVPTWANLSEQQIREKAKKLYQEAGYSKENPAIVKFTYSTNETDKKYATAITSIWNKELGVKTEMFSEEWKIHLANLSNKNFETTLQLWSADYNDAQNFLGLLESNNVQNVGGYKNAKFDALMIQAEKESDQNKRKKLLEEASKLAMDEFPVAPIYSSTNSRLIKKYVQGAYFRNPQDNYRSKEFYIVEHGKKS